MRKIYRNIINEEDVNFLLDETWKDPIFNKTGVYLNKSANVPVLNKLLEAIRKDFDFQINGYSYMRIETRPAGHKWHNDIGVKYGNESGHMQWCQLGVSILLSNENDFEGGDTYYGDDINGTNKIKSDRKQYDMCVHTSDEWHMVESHTGSRTVVLMFI